MIRDRSGTTNEEANIWFKPSPFLATKVLHHLAKSNKDTHPLTSHSILTSFYVDDFLSGESTLQEANEIRWELCRLLKSTGILCESGEAMISHFWKLYQKI